MWGMRIWIAYKPGYQYGSADVIAVLDNEAAAEAVADEYGRGDYGAWVECYDVVSEHRPVRA
jgi:uncharacterized protein YjaZ